MDIRDKIIVALDVQEHKALEKITSELKGQATFVKVGMELFYTFGPSIIETIQSNGFKVFLDLKMHDIPNTVGKTAATLTRLGVDIFNLHAAGGMEMMKNAVRGIESVLQNNPTLSRPKLIAVTQLTSTTADVLKNEILIETPLKDTILSYATNAKNAGLDGVVCSPLEVEMLKEHIDNKFLCVTPGVRPQGADLQDQKRVTTPAQAIRMGSDYLVIGRPITAAKNPAQAFEDILQEIKNA